MQRGNSYCGGWLDLSSIRIMDKTSNAVIYNELASIKSSDSFFSPIASLLGMYDAFPALGARCVVGSLLQLIVKVQASGD